MNLWTIFAGKTESVEGTKAELTSQGVYPLYSAQSGVESFLDADLTFQCIERIADEVAKIRPTHVIEAPGSLQYVNDELQQVLKKWNDEITAFDGLHKTVYGLLKNENAYVYPLYDEKYEGGKLKRKVKALYPIFPNDVKFLKKNNVKLIQFFFADGYNPVLPYQNVLHVRHKFREDDNIGTENKRGLKRKITLNNNLENSLQKATGNQINGWVKYGSALSKDKLEAGVQDFERRLLASESGILGLDHLSEYHELNREVKLIDKDTLEYLQRGIANYYKVPLSILNGTANKEEYELWWNACISPILENLEQAFTATLFSYSDRIAGHAVHFCEYDRTKFMTSSELNDAASLLSQAGAITINQLLVMYGMSPIGEEGNRRVQSLNYIDKNIANEYQLQSLKKGGKAENNDNKT